ncbi:MAG: hydroxyisourate hydrolase [Burkholderiaceae bacterium]
MGHLSTHVLDTTNGCPAVGMAVKLQRRNGSDFETIADFDLNVDGRYEGGALLDGTSIAAGCYRLVFSVAPYFKARGIELPDPPFINDVLLDFGIANPTDRYHVPLLVSPWAYSTYRGS